MNDPKARLQEASWVVCLDANKLEHNKSIGLSDKNNARCVQFSELPDVGGLALFRKNFSGTGVTSCTIEATALGIYELFCNGARVGSIDGHNTIYDELKPGWTDYHHHVMSDTYDLTPYIKDGENILLAVVAPGWWSGRISYNEYGMQPMAFKAAIRMTGVLGEQVLMTDNTWECHCGGPIHYADIWDGEWYDARCLSFGVLSSQMNTDTEWKQVTLAEHPEVSVIQRIGPQVRVRNGLSRKPSKYVIYDGTVFNGSDYGKIHVVSEGTGFVPTVLHRGQTLQLDFAQEMVGWPFIHLKASKGAILSFRVGELLNDSGLISRGNDNPEGSLYTINYRTAKAKGKYVCDDGEAFYRPMFTFYGFRYIEIKASEDIELLDITAETVGSDIRETGTLETSNPLVNRLIQNIIWGQRSNYLSVPTDCPQRDERLGWTGDTQIFVRTASYNGNVNEFFKKWLQDMRDGQTEEGAYPDIAPYERIVKTGAAAWGDAGIVVPYTMLLMYNDTELVREHYESMEKYMQFVHQHDGPLGRYNDWVAFERTDSGIIPVTYYALDAQMMMEMSQALGLQERASFYHAEYERAKSIFRTKYVVPEKGMVESSQCGYLMALKAQLLENEEIPDAVAKLKKKIIDNGYRLSTGFVGTGVLNHTLSMVGEDGLAYSLLLQQECPSWLYSINQGATTMWERWNSYTIADGFGDVGMNSFNHYAYGAVGEWMYRYMCGIEADIQAPAFKHILLQPRPDLRKDSEMPAGQERITWAKATLDTKYGRIESGWAFEKDALVYQATIPMDTTATCHLPTHGKSIYQMNGHEYQAAGQEYTVIDLGPGVYRFVI